MLTTLALVTSSMPTTQLGTTCSDMTNAVKQVGCFSESPNFALSTKYAFYKNLPDPSLLTNPAYFYQESCNLPVSVDLTLAFDATKFRRIATSKIGTQSAAGITRLISAWVWGLAPAQHGLFSTMYGSASTYATDGTTYNPLNVSSVPREGYVNIMFDTSAAAAAWMQWTAINTNIKKFKYNNVDVSPFDISSPNNRYVAAGMCTSHVSELTNMGLDAPYDFQPTFPFSLARPLRQTTLPLVDASVMMSKGHPYDGWKNTIRDALAPFAPLNSFANTCEREMQALKLQCTAFDSNDLAAKYILDIAAGTASYQTLSPDLPVVVTLRRVINSTKYLQVASRGSQAMVQMMMDSMYSADAFEYAGVAAANALVSSVISSFSLLDTAGKPLTRPTQLPREAQTTLSFVNTASAVAWMQWYVNMLFMNGEKIHKVDFSVTNMQIKDLRLIVHGMSADGVKSVKAFVGQYASYIDFAYTSTINVVRPTRYTTITGTPGSTASTASPLITLKPDNWTPLL